MVLLFGRGLSNLALCPNCIPRNRAILIIEYLLSFPFLSFPYTVLTNVLSDTPIKVQVLECINLLYPENERQEVMDSVRAMLTPARQYLASQRIKHTAALQIADVAEYVIPYRARELLVRQYPDESNKARDRFRNLLKLIPLVPRLSLEDSLNSNEKQRTAKRTAIMAELDSYLALAHGVPSDFDLVEFWIDKKRDHPNLFDLFLIIGTLQASSAFAERILSRYQRRFGDANIKDAKEDYVEASIMSEVNADAFAEALRIEVMPREAGEEAPLSEEED